MHWRDGQRASAAAVAGATDDPCPAGRELFASSYPRIINHQSALINRRGFTLIELLVVIGVIALLLAILMPSLQRVREQAMNMACRAKLRQWGELFQTEATAKSDGVVTNELQYVFTEATTTDPKQADRDALRDRHMIPPGLYLCPMATRLSREQPWESDGPWGQGSTFFASWSTRPDGQIKSASYGMNIALSTPTTSPMEGPDASGGFYWLPTVKTSLYASIPVICDSAGGTAYGVHQVGPPSYEGSLSSPVASCWPALCINRHDGGVNYLFLDWSVRKVGLKELWTLRWSPKFDTHGPWTKAGGVKPEDWPKWMRGFKDY